jgi:hypothetical protein
MNEEAEEPKLTRARIVRVVLGVVLVVGAAMTWIYPRYLVAKAPLGGACTWAMHCRADAPRCLKQSEEGAGVCSRACKVDADCAESIKCVKVELEERDDRGVPLEGGYCVPQAVLDARKRPQKDAGAPADKQASWIDVPSSPTQFEGEVVIKSVTYLLKGSLLRPSRAGERTRRIVDTSSLRSYSVDDERKTFSGTAIDASQADARVTKTGKKDRVADRECELWQIDEGKTSREACILQGAAFVDPAAGTIPAWSRELAVRTALPLRVVDVDSAGQRTVRLLVERVDAHPVDAALFAIPKSYKNAH